MVQVHVEGVLVLPQNISRLGLGTTPSLSAESKDERPPLPLFPPDHRTRRKTGKPVSSRHSLSNIHSYNIINIPSVTLILDVIFHTLLPPYNPKEADRSEFLQN